MKHGTLLASRQPGHVCGRDSPGKGLLDIGYFAIFFKNKNLKKVSIWEEGVQEELTRNKECVFYPKCNVNFDDF